MNRACRAGFGTYKDYPVNAVEVLRSSSLGWLLSRTAGRIRDSLRGVVVAAGHGGGSLDFSRKDAATINREFLEWLSTCGDRPFFAFLNYFDAHDPYLQPDGDVRRYLAGPLSGAQIAMLRDWQKLDKSTLKPAEITLAQDAYDECIAALDGALGNLIGELKRRRLLDRTVIIVTSDHGEQFGEHGGFGHGFSLFQPEVHVPLLVIGPGRVPEGRVVREPVSLRDVPATVVDLIGTAEGAPFPGASLAATWKERASAGSGPTSTPLSELKAEGEYGSLHGQSTAKGMIQAIAVDQRVYIRHQDGTEELYDLSSDPAESYDQSDLEEARPRLEECRRILEHMN